MNDESATVGLLERRFEGIGARAQIRRPLRPRAVAVAIERASSEDAMVLANGGQLNPVFVEWMMGFPRNWTLMGNEKTGRQNGKVSAGSSWAPCGHKDLSPDVTRITTTDNKLRLYFDEDEQVVRVIFRCSACGVWPDDMEHKERCPPRLRLLEGALRCGRGGDHR